MIKISCDYDARRQFCRGIANTKNQRREVKRSIIKRKIVSFEELLGKNGNETIDVSWLVK